MERIIIFGVSKLFRQNYSLIKEHFQVVALTDNNPDKKNVYINEVFIKPNLIQELDWDYILVCCLAVDDIRCQLRSYGIDDKRIKSLKEVLYHIEMSEFDWEKYFKERIRRGTSITDQPEYCALCEAAAEQASIFNVFRKSQIYTKVLEHVTYEQGQEYLNVINENTLYQYNEKDWLDFQLNDRWGSPQKYDYNINSNVNLSISPTTIRYAKVLQDIKILFNCERINTVAEIGVGYGGQARLLMDHLPTYKYYLIDLPEVLKLVSAFLNKFEGKREFILCDGTQPIDSGGGYDLLISNYAFSELTREVQDNYMKSVILQSRAGYMIWNNLSYIKFGGYSVEELLKKIPGSKIMDEIPLTSPENKLIVWGTK